MDPVAPLLIVAAIAGAAALGWRVTRSKRPHGRVRQAWKIVCHRCDRSARPTPGCDECRSVGMLPLSKYQAEGGGTGFWIADDGPLVSSLMAGEWEPSDDESNRPQGRMHLPIFDLDYRAELIEHAGTRVLVMHTNVAIHPFLRAVEAFERCRLSPPGTAEYVSAQRAKLPGIESDRISDGMSSAGVQLSVPAQLVPSSTHGHFHLYLDAAVPWDDYLALMRVMAEAGLLERGWVEMNERRRMAMLRKPEFKKAST